MRYIIDCNRNIGIDNKCSFFLFQSEDKDNGKIDWNLEGCFKALEKICQRDYFLEQIKSTLKLFLDKPVKTSRARVVDPFQDSKAALKTILDRIQVT